MILFGTPSATKSLQHLCSIYGQLSLQWVTMGQIASTSPHIRSHFVSFLFLLNDLQLKCDKKAESV